MESLKVYVQNSFLDIFYRLIENKEFEGYKLNLFSLKIKDRKFDYTLLINELTDTIINFCTSSKEYEIACSERKYGRLSRESREKFREYSKMRKGGQEYKDTTTKDGELGELILYSLLESHMVAPKILTKMRFKTSTNDPVKRADGIHLLKTDDGYYKLIYGESKLYEDYDRGLAEAFKSIDDFKNRDNNNIDTEYNFLISNLDSEFDEVRYQEIKKILIPSEEDIEYDTAFAIFIGFEIDIPDVIAKKNSFHFREEMKTHITQLIE
ncbi:MAG: HamA C-terminal domain-containing protein, partial [Clostridium sp.]